MTLVLFAGCSSPTPATCTPDSTQCSGNGVQACASNGTWGSVVLCQNQACVNGACVGSCAPGAKECTGNGVQACTSDGTWGTTSACTNQGCVSGACVGTCTPGSTQCSGNGVQTCATDGTWSAPAPCTMQACVNGACVGVCAPGSKQCDGNGVDTCASDGGWGLPVACSGQTCLQGVCTGVCAPTDLRCQSNVVQGCSSTAQWTDQATCPFLCDAGQCTGVCLPGDRQCVADGGQSQTCGTDGTWGSTQVCTNETCVAGECTGSCLRAALVDGGLDLANVSPTSSSMAGLSWSSCPNGSDANASPKICISEVNWSLATMDAGSPAPWHLDLDGTVPMRITDIPVEFACATLTAAFNGDGSCPGGTFIALPLAVQVQFDPARSNALTVTRVTDQTTATNALSAAFQICGVPACNAMCCITNLCGCALASSTNFSMVENAIIAAELPAINAQMTRRVQQQLCQTNGCPSGTAVDTNGVCSYADGGCAPRPSLFGTCP